ncbi:MAG: hypothetical protein GX304_05520 [Clostridiales bacterium]|jgi:uncharacterized membrane protein|nr:hypothetical protein [Clostridiales bacterium]
MKSYSKLIAQYAIIVALVVCSFTIDAFLTTRFLPIRAVIATTAIVLSIVQLFDFKTAVFTTTALGLVSLVFAYIFPNLAAEVMQKPVVSVLPRICIGLVSYSVLALMRKLTEKSSSPFVKKYVTSSVAAAFGVITNTLLVLSTITFYTNENFFNKLLSAIIAFNFPAELLVGIIAVPAIVNAVKDRIKPYRIENIGD